MPAEIPADLPIEQRIAAMVAQHGEAKVANRAVSLIAGNNEGEEFLIAVGGEHAQGILDGAPVLYWPELWGTRALLYVWDDSAVAGVTAALHNQAWRVREMAARVAAARVLDVAPVLTGLLSDETARALGAIGTLESVDAIRPLLRDPEIDVRRGAQQGIDSIRGRFPTDPS
ncbi:MAG: HEAT repeat domain-containing protein [Rhodoglobus sp.]